VIKTAAGVALAGGLAGCTGDDGDGGDGGGGGGGGDGDGDGDGGGNGGGDGGGNGGGDDGLSEGERPVSHLGHITYAWPEQIEKFGELYDFDIERTIVSYQGIQQNLFSGGNESFDVAGFEGIIARPALVFNDFSEGVPTDELDTYSEWSDDTVASIFTRPTERLDYLGAQAELMEETFWADPDGKTELNLVPTNYNFDSVGYNPKHIEAGSVDSWSPMFDDEYQGQVALGVVPVISVAETIMHLMDKGVLDEDVDSVNNPSQDQIDAAVDFLIEEKGAGQFRALWGQVGRSAELMSSEEAIIGNIWQPAVFGVRGNGTPCTYATMKGDIQGFALTTGGFIPTNPGSTSRNNYDEAVAWTHFHHGAWYPGFVQERTGYSVPHYPNTDLVRSGSDETGEGMGPEFYDWAYEGERTYEAVDEPFLFQPSEYDWSMEEGDPSSDGQQRDGGSVETRTDRVGTWYTWPDEGDYLSDRWTEFTGG
jgi:hypothetical protein